MHAQAFSHAICLKPAGFEPRSLSLSGAMPGRAHAPTRGQPATAFGFADLARCSDGNLKDLKDRIEELASRQVLLVKAGWFKNARFVLADREQVENREWMQWWRPAVCVSCVGKDTPKFAYGFAPRHNVAQHEVPVCYEALRGVRLKSCLWDIVAALSQGRTVVVHCNQSFHRGPCGLMAILKVLLDIPVDKTKEMILAKRDVWEGYVGQVSRQGASLARAYHWASQLKIWNPPSSRKALDTSVWANSPALSHDPDAPNERKYLYRAMTQDLVEFDAQPASSQVFEKTQLAHLVLDAVANASKQVSEFVHFSWNFEEARSWHILGRRTRGETRTMMCRVPIGALSQAVLDFERPLRHLEYVDLSDSRLSQLLMSPYVKADGQMKILPLLGALSHAEKVKEVLVAWRGIMPKNLFEVIDADTGEFIRMLDPQVLLLASSHWRQTSAEAVNSQCIVRSSPINV